MTGDAAPDFLLVPEVAARWRMSERHVRDEIGRKRLRALKFGKEWRIRPADLDAYEASLMNVRPTTKRTRAPRRRVA